MKLKKLVSNTLKYWYVYILSFCLLEIINYGALSTVVADRICFWISAVLILLFSGYICILVSVVYDRLSLIFREKEMELNQTIYDLRKYIGELDDEKKELSKELAKSLSDDISLGNNDVIRTIETNLTNGKDFITTEIQNIGNELKEIIYTNSNTLIDKSNSIIENQDKCVERIIQTEKIVANESAESLKETRNMIEENHRDNTDKQSQQYKNIIDLIEKAEEKIALEIEGNKRTVENVDAKIEDEFKTANENNKLQSEEILQQLDNNRKELELYIAAIKDGLAKGTEKTDNIIEIGNVIIENQQKSIEENQIAFINIYENQAKCTGEIKEAVCATVNEASERKLKEINDFKEIVITKVTENAKSQYLYTEELMTKLIEKIGELIQSSNGELTKHVEEQMKELNACHLNMKKTYEANNEKIEERVIELNSKTTKLINWVLDNIEDNSEKNERYINLLGNQISEAAKQNKNGITALMNELEKKKELVAEITEKLSEYTFEHKKDTEDSEKRIQEYIRGLGDYYSKCFDKIDNIQLEILSISHATNLLNNLYSKLHDSSIVNGEKETQTVQYKPERIEEYKDDESGKIVKNYYKHNKLSRSEVIVAGCMVCDFEYDNDGKTIKSHSYNEQGEMIIEREFYKNGEVKMRKEILTKNGKKETAISKFDENGNKIK